MLHPQQISAIHIQVFKQISAIISEISIYLPLSVIIRNGRVESKHQCMTKEDQGVTLKRIYYQIKKINGH